MATQEDQQIQVQETDHTNKIIKSNYIVHYQYGTQNNNGNWHGGSFYGGTFRGKWYGGGYYYSNWQGKNCLRNPCSDIPPPVNKTREELTIRAKYDTWTEPFIKKDQPL